MGFEVVKLTDAAVERIKEIISSSDQNPEGIRVGIKKVAALGWNIPLI